MSEIATITDNDIGNCLKDFEILQVLGKGAFGFVAKVKSKKNLKIYAMKKNDLSIIDDDDIKKYYENEGIFMKVLDHPNICKLYTTFKENNSVYLIMEYMDSGDLFTFLDAYKKLGEYISEEKLCIIFLQCLNSLQYIHSLGIIHRDIKPANFLYNSKGEVKLSDFNVSALQNIENAMLFTKDEEKKEELINRGTQIGSGKFQAPEINEEENYDDKVDIYSLGVTFCTVAFFKLEIPNDQNIKNIFSEKFINIIKSMMENDPKKRPSSKVLFDSLNKYYIAKFVHNTGLISCINCLSTYDSFKKYFLKEGNKINPLNEISFQFNDAIRNINNPNITKENLDFLLYKFRNLIINYGIRKNEDACSEIEPISIISFLLNKLHGELNTIKINLEGDNYLKKYVNSNNKKDEAYLNYLIFYNTNFKSIISDNFFGLIKTKRLCNHCDDIKYSFNMQSFIPFNVSILIEYFNKKKPENKNLDIYYCFDCLNKNFILLNKSTCVACEKCEAYTDHNEFKQFYSLPKNLIIFFDRGDNYKYSDFINFEEKLFLNQNYVEKFSKNYTYDLLGIICKVNEANKDDSHNKKFISFTKSKKGYIINNDKKNEYNINIIKDKNKYTVIGLFYYCKDVKSYIYNETIKKYLDLINTNMNNMNNMNNLNNMNSMNIMNSMNNMNNNNNFNENNFNNNDVLNMMGNNMNNFNNINNSNLNYNNTNNNNMNSMNNMNMNFNMNMDNMNMNYMNNNMNNNNTNNNNNMNNNMNIDMNMNNINGMDNNNMYNNNMNNMNMNIMDNNNMNNMNMNNMNFKSNNNFKSNINSNEYKNMHQSMQYNRNNISASIFKNESNNNEFRQNMSFFNNINNNGFNQNSMMSINNNQNNMNNFNNNNNGFNQNNMMRNNNNQNNMNDFNNNNNGFNQNNGYNNNYNNGFNQNNMMNNNNNGYNQNSFNNNFDRFNQNNMNNNNSYQNISMNNNNDNNNNQLNSNQPFN